MFGTILLILFTLMLVYVLGRAATVPLVTRRMRRWYLIPVGLVLWVVFFLGRFFGHGGEGTLAAVLEYTGMNVLGAVFLTFMVMLAVDLVTAFGLLLRRWAPALRGWALIAAAILVAWALIQGHRAPAVVRHEVVLKDLPADLDGTVLVAFSDTHVEKILGTGWLEARVEQVHGLSPDLVALVGDIFEGHGGPPAGAQEILARLSAPLGVYFISGNHDRSNGDVLDRAGFTRLDGAWTQVRPGLVLAGVRDLTSHRRRNLGGDPVGEALSVRPRAGTVFLSHSPLEMERAAAAGAGLMISGHTHGGQIWPFNHLVSRRYPLVAGREEVDGMTVIVTRGAGTWGPRMRLWKRGEILHLTLRSPAV
ncbi:MAG: metallophosphoesterase [bacterium]|nr:MAG: metallophosphoesterase [bacterium]